MRHLVAAVFALALTTLAHAQVTFHVSIDPTVASKAAGATEKGVSGQLVVYLMNVGARGLGNAEPADGPFLQLPQPMFAREVVDAKPGEDLVIDATSLGFPAPLDRLMASGYRVQAVLWTDRSSSQWRRNPGTLYSAPSEFMVAYELAEPDDAESARLVKPTRVNLTLSKLVAEPTPPKSERTTIVRIRSAALSAFHGKDVFVRAAVVAPINFNAENKERKYPAVYHIPGFGGDHFEAYRIEKQLASKSEKSIDGILARNTFQIVLDPESPNGHTLFADSDVNGPWGTALTKELIPALEQQYPLVAKPEARVLRGHSSGGWSCVWLQTTYPTVFGGAWSSSPDPVDFRKFQLVDIYTETNVYSGLAGDYASYTDLDGVTRMTIRQENMIEELLGPRGSSGQQWDSWQAVFGPRATSGRAVPLYDATTGAIDKTVAESFRRFDITDRLRRDPAKFVPIFRNQVRLLTGDKDNYALHEAVKLLQAELDKVDPKGTGPGYITIVPGVDHGTIFGTDAMRQMTVQMLEHFRTAGLIAKEPGQ